MTSYELQSKIQDFLQNQDSEYLQSTLRRVAEMSVVLTEATQNFYLNRGESKDAEALTTQIISEINLELKKIPPGRIFRQLDALNQSFKGLDFPRILLFFYDTSENPDLLSNISSSLDSVRYSSSEFYNLTNRFESSYEEFLEASNVSNIFSLLKYGHTLYLITLNTKLLLEDIYDKFNETSIKKISDSQKELFIFLHSSNNLQVLISKLESLNVIYTELCRLLNVSTAEYPLKVIKVESGSLWIKLFGESKVIAFMTDSIKEVANFLYRNFTNEGKLSSIPNQIEGVTTTLNLESKMKELGYDTSEMRESIAKSAAVIAKNQNILLSGEAEVTINEETFSVGSTIDKLIAERIQMHLLEGESDETKLLGNGNSSKE